MKRKNYYQVHLNKKPKTKNSHWRKLNLCLARINKSMDKYIDSLHSVSSALGDIVEVINKNNAKQRYYFNDGEIGVECVRLPNEKIEVVHQGM